MKSLMYVCWLLLLGALIIRIFFVQGGHEIPHPNHFEIVHNDDDDV